MRSQRPSRRNPDKAGASAAPGSSSCANLVSTRPRMPIFRLSRRSRAAAKRVTCSAFHARPFTLSTTKSTGRRPGAPPDDEIRRREAPRAEPASSTPWVARPPTAAAPGWSPEATSARRARRPRVMAEPTGRPEPAVRVMSARGVLLPIRLLCYKAYMAVRAIGSRAAPATHVVQAHRGASTVLVQAPTTNSRLPLEDRIRRRPLERCRPGRRRGAVLLRRIPEAHRPRRRRVRVAVSVSRRRKSRRRAR